MNPTRTDCLVIGAGAAGAVYAVQAARAGLHVTLITGAAELNASNSLWTQDGIIYDEGGGDLLRADIDAASGHSANPAAVDAIVRDGPRLVRELLIDDLQVGFDRDTGGALKFTREASHSRHRIIYAEDHTGRAILTALHERLAELAAAGTLPGGGSLTVATGCFAVDLLTLSHSSVDFLDRYRPLSCIGAHVLDVAAGEARPIMAKKTVLATGGLGQLYLHSTNDMGAYGHGVAMAYRVGARVIDMEYVQFHPTVFHRRGERPFLISEAVRGEGGVLINQQGEAFMERYHPDGSLAPRDVISRSIHSELLRGASDSVYIDLSGVEADYARRRFPTINARLLAAGVDMTREPIPVVPAAHYACGGIHTDMAGNTNIAHLSAIGETACTGLHGANRLASTSLLECVVNGRIRRPPARRRDCRRRGISPARGAPLGDGVRRAGRRADHPGPARDPQHHVELRRAGAHHQAPRPRQPPAARAEERNRRLLRRQCPHPAPAGPAQRRADRPADHLRRPAQPAQRRLPLPQRLPRPHPPARLTETGDQPAIPVHRLSWYSPKIVSSRRPRCTGFHGLRRHGVAGAGGPTTGRRAVVRCAGFAMRLWGGSVGPILWPWGSTRRFWPNSMPLRAGHWRCAGATLLSGPTNRCWTTPSIARSILWKNTASGASSTSRTGSGMAAFEYRQAEEIRDALRRHGVRYLFIGKSGAILLGYPDTTQDADLFVEKNSENGHALIRALRELDFALTDVQQAEIVRGKDFVQLKSGPFDLDLVFAPDGIERFQDAFDRRVDVEGFPVCSIDDIIASKEASNRAKDRESLPRLRSFREYYRQR